MKSSLLKLKLALVVVIAVMASCSNESNFGYQTSKEPNTNVVKDLENVNTELLSKLPVGTRGTKWNFKQTASVITTDLGGAWKGVKWGGDVGRKIGLCMGNPAVGFFAGAMLGGVVVGSFSSWLVSPDAWFVKAPNDFERIKDFCTKLTDDQMNFKNEIVGFTIVDSTAKTNIDMIEELIAQSKLDRRSLNIGRAHNIMLSAMDGSVIINEKKRNINSNSKIKKAILDSKEFVDGCKSIAMNINSEQVLNDDPVLNKVMDLFSHIIEEYPSEVNDVAFLVGKYVEIIDRTNELSSEQKECIKSGLATALYSAQYWQSKLERK